MIYSIKTTLCYVPGNILLCFGATFIIKHISRTNRWKLMVHEVLSLALCLASPVPRDGGS